jgi:hypothetical protein
MDRPPDGPGDRGRVGWQIPDDRPSPALATRAFIAGGLLVLWFLGSVVAAFNMWGDCNGPPADVCDTAATVSEQRVGAMFLILAANTIVAILAALRDRPTEYLILALVSGATTALALVAWIAWVQPEPARLAHPIPSLVHYVWPGSVVLLVAAIFAVRRTRHRLGPSA